MSVPFQVLPVPCRRRRRRPRTDRDPPGGRPDIVRVEACVCGGVGKRRRRLSQQPEDEVDVGAVVAAKPRCLCVADVCKEAGQLGVTP